ALGESLSSAKEAILELFTPRERLDILWLKYDFLNAKSLLKAKLSGEGTGQLNNLGKIPLADLREAIFEGKSKKLPWGLDKAIYAAGVAFENTGKPQEIDAILDGQYLEVFGQEIKKIKSPILNDFLRREIDLFNIKTYFRLQDDEVCGENIFLAGGLIPLRRFRKTGKEDKLIRSIEDFSEAKEFGDLRDRVEKDGLLSLELEGRKILLAILEAAHYKILGIEPVFAFWQTKAEETKMIHKILAMKNAGIASAEIHRMIGVAI
ncbi:MAG: V-type ATPase subunit, partial [bacterium]|nr:V-type ATPase subunit [bacterium]